MIVFVTGMITSLQAQINNNVYNFTVVDGSVQWKKIYETSLTIDELEESLKNNTVTSKLERDEDVFTGMIKSLGKINNGYRAVEAFVKIEVKDGRYRVFIKDITLDPTHVSLKGYSIDDDTRRLLSSFVVNKNKGTLKRKSALSVYNKYFTDTFKLAKIQLDNW